MLAACAVATAAHLAQQVPFMVIDLGVPVLLYTVTVRYRRRHSLAVLGGLLLAVTGWCLYTVAKAQPFPAVPNLIAAAPGDLPDAGQDTPAAQQRLVVLQNTWSAVLMLGSILVASWAIGSAARNRRAYLDELHARAEELERQRDQQAAFAVAAERSRISRELHDVVAHGLSVMVTQAQGAEALLERQPGQSRTALAAIIKVGRDSLADMRRVLSRVDGVEDAWHPQPGIQRLPALVAQVTDAGTPVRLHTEGTVAALPSAVDLSIYRIAQEALTNTMKHAGPGAAARLVLTYRDTEIDIEVDDDGLGTTTTDGNGNGLRGMRERVRLLGGQFAAGPGPDGGFTVKATLPIQGPHE